MRRFSKKVLVCLLSAGLVCGLSGGIALGVEPEDSTALTGEEACEGCTGENDSGCCCCTGECGETDTGELQTLALTPEEPTNSYHGHSFGELEITEVDDLVSLDIGKSIVLTVYPYAHVQYVGCRKGEGCGPGLCNGGDDQGKYICWYENKGCCCDGRDGRYNRLRLASVAVETDSEGILSCETVCDYSMLEEAGDMTDGQIILTAQEEGVTTVTVTVALYDWVDAEVTFTVVAGDAEEPDTGEPDTGEPDTGEPDTGEPDTGEPDTGNPDTGEPDTGEPDTGEPDTGEPDTGSPDTGEPDTGTPDTGEPDTGTPDTGEPDTGEPDTGEPDTGEPDTGEPDTGNPDTGTSGSGSGVIEIEKDTDGNWYSFRNGERVNYTGFGTNSNGEWYVENGKVTFAKQDIIKDTNTALGSVDAWYYVIGSKVQRDFTGLGNFGNANGWWYIDHGKVDFTHNGVDKNNNGWWYVTGGKVQFGYTGVANYKNDNGWWYIKGGKVDFTRNSVDQNNNGWWYVTGGKVQFGYTGLANYKNANGWWYIQSGKVDFTHSGVDKNVNGWFYTKGGKVDFAYQGIASNQNGTWYVSGGTVQFGFTGNVTLGGKTYKVTNGKVS